MAAWYSWSLSMRALSSSPRNRETLVSCSAAHTLAQRATSSSSVNGDVSHDTIIVSHCFLCSKTRSSSRDAVWKPSPLE